MLTGCSFFERIEVNSIKTKPIPVDIAFYPLLSSEITWITYKTPLQIEVIKKRRRAIESDSGESTTGQRIGVSEKDKEILITPPANSSLTITEESQLMTSSISYELALHGFKLKEIPIDVTNIKKQDAKSKHVNSFGVSVHLLNRLKDSHGVKALVVGNASFVGHNYEESYIEKRVTFVHLKVIDIESLEIIGQINFPYNHKGASINLVSQKVALELAILADTDAKKLKKVI